MIHQSEVMKMTINFREMLFINYFTLKNKINMNFYDRLEVELILADYSNHDQVLLDELIDHFKIHE